MSVWVVGVGDTGQTREHKTTSKQSTNLKDLRTKMETTLGFTTTTRRMKYKGVFQPQNSHQTRFNNKKMKNKMNLTMGITTTTQTGTIRDTNITRLQE